MANNVELNIRGRDDGAGRVVDSLREKLIRLANEGEKVNSIREIAYSYYDTRKEQIRKDYKDVRQASDLEYEEDKMSYEKGRLTETEFKKRQREYTESIKELDIAESNEIRDVEIEQKNILREILDEVRQQRNNEVKEKQRGNNEFNDNELNSDEGLRVFVTNWPERFNTPSNKTSNNTPNSENEIDNRGQFGAGFRQTLMGGARGDLNSIIMGGAEMSMSMFGKSGGVLAGLMMALLAINESMSQGEKVLNNLAPAISMRSGFGYGSDSNISTQMRSMISRGQLSTDMGGLGITGDVFASEVVRKLNSSRNADGHIFQRTLDDLAFRQGFGADIGLFDKFERFTKNGEESLNIALDVLNVLTSIKESSLKETDLTTLIEKLQSQEAILNIQRGRRDIVDTGNATNILAAFERLGLSQKGERAGDFLTRTLQGFGENGDDTEMLLKYEAVKRAHPEIANSPTELRKFLRYNADDPAYMTSFGQLIKEISGGSDMAMDDMILKFWNPQTMAEHQMMLDFINGVNGSYDALNGRGINRSIKTSLNREQMYEDAAATVSDRQVMEARTKNQAQENALVVTEPIVTKIGELLDFFRDKPIKAVIMNTTLPGSLWKLYENSTKSGN